MTKRKMVGFAFLPDIAKGMKAEFNKLVRMGMRKDAAVNKVIKDFDLPKNHATEFKKTVKGGMK